MPRFPDKPNEIKHYDDEKLAWLLFIDGCAVLCVIRYNSKPIPIFYPPFEGKYDSCQLKLVMIEVVIGFYNNPCVMDEGEIERAFGEELELGLTELGNLENQKLGIGNEMNWEKKEMIGEKKIGVKELPDINVGERIMEQPKRGPNWEMNWEKRKRVGEKKIRVKELPDINVGERIMEHPNREAQIGEAAEGLTRQEDNPLTKLTENAVGGNPAKE
ncbi:hypothetical protein F3Y22_tig00111644pilonHSYRG00049 [Hibiscus syriacus]|uniref:Uncharacterized protein n=1 Tax=Hibiscus syriacus TaxID=106335 RepID=A0A6A2XJN9_HIBSY|nr:hypothetical protein F3Y22_tig00111644pilonHSYRG00049 [Hibiscus syriacus]